MEIKEEVRKNILLAIEKKWPDLKVGKKEIELNYPIAEFGDYASNIALKISTRLEKSPLDIAEKITREVENSENGMFEKVSFEKPGFINFSLSKKYFNQEIKNVLDLKEKWGETTELENKNYIFEHSSPNLFKPFHIGHLVNNAIGESLVRIIKKSGIADLTTLSFPSDISPGIAKTVWAIREKKWEDEMTIEKIGEAYVFGTKEYKENEKAKEDINLINKSLYLKEGSREMEIYEKGQKLSLDYFRETTKRLGSDFDELIFESEAEAVGKKIIKENIPKVFRESEG
ncbi:MAG: arginine--tRNA ligase, partial [Patescibacteria group bacterium]|nr:arginine--tRNA ligase [Patescibacteria group bacterium]